jgi:hypothetical protein
MRGGGLTPTLVDGSTSNKRSIANAFDATLLGGVLTIINNDQRGQSRQRQARQFLGTSSTGNAEPYPRIIDNMAQLDLAVLCIHQHNNAPGEVRSQIGSDKRRTIVHE